MDNREIADTFIDKEAPTPMHWQTCRDWSVRKIAAFLDAKDVEIARLSLMYRLAWSECEAHRNYPEDDEMNTGDPENEAVNLINMAKLGTAMDDHDAARKEVGL